MNNTDSRNSLSDLAQTTTIRQAALDAYQASMDAHGFAVVPETAYAFIREQVWEEDGCAGLLPEQMSEGFRREYCNLVYASEKASA